MNVNIFEIGDEVKFTSGGDVWGCASRVHWGTVYGLFEPLPWVKVLVESTNMVWRVPLDKLTMIKKKEKEMDVEELTEELEGVIAATKRALDVINKITESPELKLGQKWQFKGKGVEPFFNDIYLLSRIDNEETTFALVNMDGSGTWSEPKTNLYEVFGYQSKDDFYLLEDV